MEKTYFVRKAFGVVPYYFGWAVLIIAGLVLVFGSASTSTSFAIPAFFGIFFGGHNRKPRVQVNGDAVVIQVGPGKSPRELKISDIENVSEDGGVIRFKFKEGADIRLPKREFSKKERTRLVADMQELIAQ